MSNKKNYPLLPGQTHIEPYYTQVPTEEYKANMRELKAFNCVESDLQEFCEPRLVYLKSEADKVIAELKENHKKEVERLLMKISSLELLVKNANKIIKQKSGFTIKDVKFGGVKLEGTNTHKKEA